MIADVWHSFRRLPLWVQIWVALILVPVNLLPLLFVGAPYGLWVAALSVGGMLPNLYFMLAERGFSKRMALSHLLLWPPLVLLLGWMLMSGLPVSGSYWAVLVALLVVDLVSLAFDVKDGWQWYRGDRAVA